MKKPLVVLGTLIWSAAALCASAVTAPSNISPEAQQFLNKRPAGNLDAGGDMSDPEILARIRTSLGKMFLKNARQIDPDLDLTPQEIGELDGVWVNSEAPEKPGPVIVYFHGGGYILGSAETNIGSAIRIHRASGIPVLSVEYRLAPEHPFPASVDDAVSTYRWLLKKGYQPNQIGIYGDSAGGGISLALGLSLQQQKLPLPGAIAVLSPLVDLSGEGDSRITLKNVDPVLRTPINGRYDMYMADADVKNPLLSPVHGDYKNYSPMLIQVGTRERLLSDSVRLATKARADGADVTLDIWDGMWHGFHDTPNIPEAEQACDRLAAFFTRHLQ